MPVLNPNAAHWLKSGRIDLCNTCAEVAISGQLVGLRDAKNPTGPNLTRPVRSFTSMVTTLK